MRVLETLSYTGPNRRAVVCAHEILVQAETVETVSVGTLKFRHRLIEAMPEVVAANIPENDQKEEAGAGPLALLGHYYGAIAVALQRSAGHDVRFHTVVSDHDPKRIRVVFEYEHDEVGRRASDLALQLLAKAEPDLDLADMLEDQRAEFASQFEEFRTYAASCVFPADARAIMDAAARRDIPCVKLEREPYEGLKGDFRIRRNGLLKLGHSMHTLVLDGTLCLDRNTSLVPMFWDRSLLYRRLSGFGLPIPHRMPGQGGLKDTGQALSAAVNIGFPLAVKPRRRTRGRGVRIGVAGAEELSGAVSLALRHGEEFILERHIAGETYRVLAVAGEVLAVLPADGRGDRLAQTHPSTVEMVRGLARASGAGLLLADIVTPCLDRPLQACGGALVDLDFAPELDRYLSDRSSLHREAMTRFMDWLFPPGTRSRIPLVAVTGTNGKTTTSRMIASIVNQSGLRPGLACSDGVYINGELYEPGDKSGFSGHHRVFEARDIDFGVLETARGALAFSGFMFDWCNVAVCLNVTPDHLGEYGIETVNEMAELKRSVLERARDAVVLNADDERCRAMLPHLSAANTCLVSMQEDYVELSREYPNVRCFCVLEFIDEEESLVLYQGGARVPVMRTGEIPAVYGGLARINISNAQHALAAAHLAGMEIEVAAQALRGFTLDFESNPGRLNFYHEHPFTVILDFAHNADGFRKLADFVNALEVRGRRMLMFQIRGDQADRDIRAMARAVAGRYDHCVFRSHPAYPGEDVPHVLDLVRATFLECGVDGRQLTLLTDPDLAVDALLRMGRAGDLLVFTPGAKQRVETWQHIIGYQADRQAEV